MRKFAVNSRVKRFMKTFILTWFITLGIYVSIDVCWQLLEVVFYGSVRPDIADSIVGFILTVLIFDRLRIKINV